MSFFYVLHVKCVCLREAMGPSRAADEEFPPGTTDKFFTALRELGWVERNGIWLCGEKCPGSPFDLSQFRRLSNYKSRTINPDFFDTVTVENL